LFNDPLRFTLGGCRGVAHRLSLGLFLGELVR